MGRKQCGKRRNCSLRAISPFPALFSKDLYCRHAKTRDFLGKGYLCTEKKSFHAAEGGLPLETLWQKKKMLVTSLFFHFRSMLSIISKGNSVMSGRMLFIICKFFRTILDDFFSFGKELKYLYSHGVKYKQGSSGIFWRIFASQLCISM